MIERSCRTVHVSMSGIGLMIGLQWFEKEDNGTVEFKTVHLEYPDGGVMESVKKALEMLVPSYNSIYPGVTRLGIASEFLDNDPELFDMVADAEEPEQCFISRYILEYQAGKNAAIRRFERELLNKLYPNRKGLSV